MAVITTRGCDYDRHITATDCSVCDEMLRPPFVAWMCHGRHLFFCGPCCRKIKNGFVADMIQCSAIVEMGALGDGYDYHNQTLVRRSIKEVEEDERRKVTSFSLKPAVK